MTTTLHTIRKITITSGNPDDCGKRIALKLRRDGDCYRWYCGQKDSDVSGRTVAEACNEARKAWAGSGWGLRGKAMNF